MLVKSLQKANLYIRSVEYTGWQLIGVYIRIIFVFAD